MLKILSNIIRDFANILAYKAEGDPLFKAIDNSLKLMDPGGEKAKNINNMITFTVEGPNLKRGIGFLENAARTIGFRLEAFKKNPEAGAVVKTYEEIQNLYNEALDSGKKAIGSKDPEEKNKLLNTATKNIITVQNLLKKNEKLIEQFQ